MDLVPALSVQMASAITDARLVLTRDGKPVVMWVGGGPAVSHVVGWNGTAWDTTYGTLIAMPGDGSASEIALAIDSTGAPTAAWTESSTSTGAKKIYVWKSNY